MSSLVWRLLAAQASTSINTNLFTWGDNTFGTLGAGTVNTYYSWATISAGGTHTVALRSDGIIFAWGANGQGQLGDGTTFDRSSPVQVGANYSYTAVSAGNQHTIAIRSDSTLWGWGNNTYGQLANYNVNINYSNPVNINSILSWTQISAGAFHNAAITSTGGLYTWGYDASGQLGDRKSFIFITSTLSNVQALKSDNTLWVWGDNTFGQLGINAVTQMNSPVQVFGSWISVATGGPSNENFSTGIQSDGTLWTWGSNLRGQLAQTSGTVFSPIQVGNLSNYVGVAAAGPNIFFWNTAGTLFGSGQGPLGDGLTIARSSPVQIATFSNRIVKVAPIFDNNTALVSAYVLLDNGALYAWGRNGDGQLGDSTTINRSTPIQIPGTYIDFAYGGNNQANGVAVMALTPTYQLYGWGRNNEGQLGDGTLVSRSSPTQIGTTSWTVVYNANGTFYGYRADTSNLLWGWGNNDVGQLGDNTTTNKNSPIVVYAGPSRSVTTPTAYSITYGGAGSAYNVITYNDIHNLNNSDFTIEAFIYPTTIAAQGILSNGTTSISQFSFSLDSSNQLVFSFYLNPTSTIQTIQGTIAVTTNVWTHVAVMRVSGVIGLYINGLLNTSLFIGQASLTFGTSTTPQIRIGAVGTSIFAGNISNLRLIKRAMYSNGFAVPPLPLRNITDTILLTNQSATIIDNSTYNWTITNAGPGTPLPTVSTSVVPTYITTYSNPLAGITGAGFPGFFILENNGRLLTIGGQQFAGRSFVYQSSSNNPDYQPYLIKVGNSSFTSVSAGKFTTAAITTTNKLLTWGLNEYGQLGDGTTIIRSQPVQIGVSSWSLVSTNGSYAAAIRSDGGLFTWGVNNLGQLGNNSTGSGLFWDQIIDGGNHLIALRSDGRLFTYGRNNVGQLGDGTTLNRSSPVQIGTSSWINVSGGFEHTVAIRNDGTLWGWGNNTLGQLGTGELTQSRYSVLFVGTNIVGLRSDGTIWGYGSNTSGSLGQNDTLGRSSPVQIGVGSSWLDISANGSTFLAIRNDSTLWGWGLGSSGQLGDGSTVSRSSPIQIPTATVPTKIFTGGNNSLTGAYIDVQARLWMFGSNQVGELGDGTTINRSRPVQIPGSWTSVSLGQPSSNQNTLGLKTDGTLYSWGGNQFGQLGLGNTIARSSPTQVGVSSFIQISSQGNYSFAITTDSRLFAWGNNSNGWLGQNNTISRSFPVQILGSYTFIQAGSAFAIAQKTDNSIVAWGSNSNGELGDRTTINRSSPVQVTSGSENYSLSNIRYGQTNTAAAYKNNQLYVWGNNSINNFLDGTLIASRSSPTLVGFNLIDYSSPVQIGTLSNWSTVAAGQYHTLAIDITGSLFGWGRNYEGQLGNVLYLNNTSWKKLAGGANDFVVGISNNDTLYAWGLGTTGQIGFGDTIARSSPVQIGAETYIDITAGPGHVLAIRSDGSVYGWGANNTVASVAAGGFSWVQIASGFQSSHAVAIRSDNTVWTWGLNSSGQLGDSTTVSRSSPVQLWSTPANAPPLVTWSTLAVAGTSTYVLRSDGVMFGFGANALGQLGQNDTVARSSPVQIGTDIRSIIGGSNRNAGYITNNNILFTFGLNSSAGLLGDGTTIDRSSPVQLGSFTQVSMGDFHSMGIRPDGSLWAWGTNLFGCFGNNSNNENRSSPVQIGSSSWSLVSVGQYTTYAITSDSRLFAWGRNNVGQVGDTTTVDRSNPVQISGSYVSVAAGNSYALALRTDKTLIGWGNNTFGQTGTPLIQYSYIAPQFGVRTTGEVFIWGANTNGQVGDSSTISRSSPVQLGAASWISVTKTVQYRLGIRSDGSLWAWGRNTNGELGLNDTVSRSSPIQVGSSSWTFVDASDSFGLAAAIRIDGALFTWGTNFYNQLGDVNYQIRPRSSPGQIGTSSWTSVAVGENTCAAIDTAGRIYTWGYNLHGAIGYPTPLTFSSIIGPDVIRSSDGRIWTWGGGPATDFAGPNSTRSFPIQLAGASDWTLITGGPSTRLGIKNNGTLWAWGNNGNGQLGDGTTISRSSPVQIGTDTNWSTVVLMSATTLAIKTDGTLYAWGSDSNGGLGLNTANIDRSSPTQITSVTGSWITCATGYGTSAAIRSDGRLYTWGFNGNGNLGDGTTIARSTPTQIGIQSWVQVSLNIDNTWARSSTGTVWGWGWNVSNGTVGDNTTISRSSPVQIGTSSFTMIAAFVGGCFGISTGRLFGWGSNIDGSLGDGTTARRSAPVQIGALTTWTNVERHNAAYPGGFGIIGTDIYSWGVNTPSQPGVGDNTSISRSSPVQIGTPALVVNSPTQLGTSSWTIVTAGADHIVARTITGNNFAWGRNNDGQLGDNTITSRSSPVQTATGKNFTQIIANFSNTVALDSLGKIWGWGTNIGGTLGDNSTVARSSPVQIVATGSWNFIALGNASVYARNTAGLLWVWGNNTNGNLGDLTTVNKSSPVQLANLIPVISSPTVIGADYDSASTGGDAGYSINSSRIGFAWGVNNNGQLGQNDTVNRSTVTFVPYSITAIDRSSPVQVLSGSWSSVMATNFNGAAVIRNDKTLWVWGLNTTGALGDGTTINRSVPIQISGSWNQVVTGSSWMAALKSNNTLWAWGDLLGSILGNFTQTYRSSPVQIGVSSWTQIAAGFSHLVALGTDGKVYSWGNNTNFQAATTNKLPIPYRQITWPSQSAAYGLNILGQLYAWGDPFNGPLSFGYNDNGTTARSSPVQIAAGSSFTLIASSSDVNISHMMAVDSNNIIYAWGFNGSGQLGLDDTVNRSSAVQLSSLVGVSVSKILLTLNASYLLTNNGTLYAWGLNSSGQLGDNTTINRSSPVQLAGSWRDVNIGGSHVVAITIDNRLFVWGNNNIGQLGDNTTISRSSPVQVGIGLSFINVEASASTTYVIDTTNRLFAFGDNALGQIGDGTAINRSSPVQVAGTWTAIKPALPNVAYGIQNGRIFSWGSNVDGALGDSAITPSRATPGQILQGISNVQTILPGFRRAQVYLTNGTGFYWGSNVGGNLGDGTTLNRSNPVQITSEQIVYSPVLISTSSFTSVFAQANNSAALSLNRGLFVWGNNTFGQLGQRTLVSGGPYRYQSSFTFSSAMVGASNIYGLSSLHTFAAGRNITGSLGDNTTVNKSSPITITAGLVRPIFVSPTHIGTSSWSQVSAGVNHTMLIDPNYLLYGMGSNASGHLGDNTVVAKSSPTQIGTNSYLQVSAGNFYTGAIRTNNTLWMWGLNSSGQLGDNTTVDKSSPVQVSGIFTKIEAGSGTHTGAISLSNQLFMWGANPVGALNTNTILPRSSPVQIGTKYYRDIAITDNSTSATDLNGNIESFGSNQYGQLGNNNV